MRNVKKNHLRKEIHAKIYLLKVLNLKNLLHPENSFKKIKINNTILISNTSPINTKYNSRTVQMQEISFC